MPNHFSSNLIRRATFVALLALAPAAFAEAKEIPLPKSSTNDIDRALEAYADATDATPHKKGSYRVKRNRAVAGRRLVRIQTPPPAQQSQSAPQKIVVSVP